MNGFATFLLTQVSFLSRFQLLKILTNMSEYTVLQENLNKLVTAYFSAPTTHLQKIQITDTEIKSYDGDVCPVIDHCYLQYKIIQLDNSIYLEAKIHMQSYHSVVVAGYQHAKCLEGW